VAWTAHRIRGKRKRTDARAMNRHRGGRGKRRGLPMFCRVWGERRKGHCWGGGEKKPVTSGFGEKEKGGGRGSDPLVGRKTGGGGRQRYPSHEGAYSSQRKGT